MAVDIKAIRGKVIDLAVRNPTLDACAFSLIHQDIPALCDELEKYQAGNVPVTQIIQDNETLAIENGELKERIEELEKELSEKGEYGYSQYVVDALTKERDNLKRRIEELEKELACYKHYLERNGYGVQLHDIAKEISESEE